MRQDSSSTDSNIRLTSIGLTNVTFMLMSTVSRFAVYDRMVEVGVMVCPVMFIMVPNSAGSGLPIQANISPSTRIMPAIPIFSNEKINMGKTDVVPTSYILL